MLIIQGGRIDIFYYCGLTLALIWASQFQMGPKRSPTNVSQTAPTHVRREGNSSSKFPIPQTPTSRPTPSLSSRPPWQPPPQPAAAPAAGRSAPPPQAARGMLRRRAWGAFLSPPLPPRSAASATAAARPSRWPGASACAPTASGRTSSGSSSSPSRVTPWCAPRTPSSSPSPAVPPPGPQFPPFLALHYLSLRLLSTG